MLTGLICKSVSVSADTSQRGAAVSVGLQMEPANTSGLMRQAATPSRGVQRLGSLQDNGSGGARRQARNMKRPANMQRTAAGRA